MRDLIKRTLAILCVCMLVISEVPASAAEGVAALAGAVSEQEVETSAKRDEAKTGEEVSGSIYVATQKELKAALNSKDVADGKSVTIRIETTKSVTFTIPAGDYTNVTFCVEGAKAKVKNNASVGRMVIYDAKTYTEYAQDNDLFIYDKKLTVNADKKAKIGSVSISNSKSKITIKNDGVIDKIEAISSTDLKITQNNKLNELTLKKSAKVDMSGSVKSATLINVEKKANGSTVLTSVPANIKLYGGADITFRTGASNIKSSVALMNEGIGYSVKNSTKKAISITAVDGKTTSVKKNKTVEVEADIDIEVPEVPEGAPDGDAKDTSEQSKGAETQITSDTSDESSSDSYIRYITYYEVSFAAGAGLDTAGLNLPDSKMYQKGSWLGELPSASKQNMAFLGWYYDPSCTNPAAKNDLIEHDITLYAKMTEMNGVVEEELPNYTSVTLPVNAVSSYTFGINNYSSEDVTFSNITGGNEAVPFTVGADGTVHVSLEQGKTYQVVLEDEAPDVFVIDGVVQPQSIRTFNIITEKDETQNLSLSTGMIYIPASDVSNMTGEVLDGLFTASLSANSSAEVEQNRYNGAFTYYAGTLAVGDTVAIYSGTRPDLRQKDSDNDAVAYVTITGKAGNRYSYSNANAQNVLFVPDVLPVPVSADTDGDRYNNSITVGLDVMDFSDDAYIELGLSLSTTVDVGDFMVLYEGSMTDPSSYQYVRITSVNKGVSSYTIAYDISSEAEMNAAMDIYSTRNEDIELSDEEIAQIEEEVERQAYASGFIDEAAAYLTALAIETDGFKELSEELDLDIASYRMSYADGTEVQPGDLSLMAGGKAKITKKQANVAVSAGSGLQHFEDSNGVRLELSLEFTVEIADKVEITVQAIFEQELILSVNVSGGAIKKKVWAFIYKIEDYELNANLDVGTYTGIGITATAKMKEEEDEPFIWDETKETKIATRMKNLTEQLLELESGLSGGFMGKSWGGENTTEFAGSVGGGLQEKYADFIEEVNDSWFDIVRVKLFSAEGTVDPFHILCYGIGADFVVKVNLYVTLGLTFSYGNAKRYNFSVKVFSKSTSNQTIDLEEANYNFDFYVFGTLGFRAGIELEVKVGLFSLALDSVGICAEAGAYAQFWGYFYYHCSWTKSGGKSSGCSGAMLIEVGVYLEISFKAQLLSNDNLTYKPMLFEKAIPILQVGQRENVYDFAELSEKERTIEIKGAKTASFPTNFFDMNYQELRTGKLFGSDADDPDDDPPQSLYDVRTDNFSVSSDNPKISYNLATNTVTVNPQGSIDEKATITIVYKGGTLSFSTEPIKREVKVIWSDEAGARFIQFASNGGSNVNMIRSGVGAAVTIPQNPTKIGYTFGGWYKDQSCSTPFQFPATMPDYNTSAGRGIVVYAKWIPAVNTRYTVEHYIQKTNGSYELKETETKTGTTDALTAAAVKTSSDYLHYTAKAFEQQHIAANGSSVVKVYYQLKNYTVSFTYGNLAGAADDTAPVTVTGKYGSSAFVPMLSVGGYIFAGFADESGRSLVYDAETRTITITGNAVYNAAWTYADDTHFEVDRYVETIGGGAYELAEENGVIEGQGTTNSLIDIYSEEYGEAGLRVVRATSNGEAVSQPAIAANGSTVVKIFYDRIPYELKFNTMGGNVLQSVMVKYGAAPASVQVPQRTGYTFGGWFTDRDLNDPFVLESFKMPAKEYTLFAKWIAGTDTPFLIKRYSEKTASEGYELFAVDPAISGQGTTMSVIDIHNEDYSAEGYILDHAEVAGERVTAPVIAADGSTEVELYFTRKQYELTYETNGGSTIDVSMCKYGFAPAVPAVPTKQGYVFDGWFTDQGLSTPFTFGEDTMPIGGIKVYAKWAPATDTAYTVERYVKALEGTEYLQDTSLPALACTGTTEAVIDINADEFKVSGLTFEYAKVGETEVTAPVIRADGTTVVKLYFKRNEYTLSFESKLGSTVAPARYKFGERPSAPLTPTRLGYGFGGWFIDEGLQTPYVFEQESMPAHDLILHAAWAPNTNTVYKVQYYQQNVDATGYDQAAVEELRGTTDTTVQAEVKSYGHFVLNTEIEDTVASGLIAADGSTVLKLYYDRELLTVEYEANGGSFADGKGEPRVFRYGQTFGYDAPERTDYAFDGWYAGTTKFTGSTVTESMTLTAHWLANGVNYTVIHYVMDTAGNYQTAPTLTETKSGAVDSEITYAELKNSTLEVDGGIGYRYAEKDGTVVETGTVIKGMTVKLFYSRSCHNFSYIVVAGLNDTETIVQSLPVSYYYGQEIESPELPVEGYHYQWIDTIPREMPAEDLCCKVRQIPNDYTLSFNTNGGSITASQTTAYEAAMTKPSDPSKTGYVFADWYYDNETFAHAVDFEHDTMPAGNTELFAKWTPAANTSYRVERYGANLSGDGYAPMTVNARVDCTGTTDSVIDINADSFAAEGFVLVSAKVDNEEVSDPVIAANGGTIVKLYFDRLRYNLSFDTNGGSAVTAASYKYEEAIAAPSGVPEKTGYSFGGWYLDNGTFASSVDFGTEVMPIGGKTIYAKWNPNTNTVYTVEFYGEKLDASLGYEVYSSYPSTTGTGTTDSEIDLMQYYSACKGFTFDHATVNGVDVSSPTIGGDGQTVVKMYFKRTEYPVWYDDMQNPGVEDTQYYRYGETMTATTYVPSRQGYVFAGWSRYIKSLDDWYLFDFEEETMPAENLALGPLWSPANDTPFTIIRYGEKLDGTYEPLPGYEEEEHCTGTTTDIPWVELSVEVPGYARSVIKQDGTEVDFPHIGAEGTTVIEIYYLRRNYTVTFNTGHFAPEIEPMSFVYGEAMEAPEDPTWDGFIFDGWFTDQYGEDPFVFSGATMPAHDMTLHAAWKSNAQQFAQDASNNGYATFEGAYHGEDIEITYSGSSDLRLDIGANELGKIIINAPNTSRIEISGEGKISHLDLGSSSCTVSSEATITKLEIYKSITINISDNKAIQYLTVHQGEYEFNTDSTVVECDCGGFTGTITMSGWRIVYSNGIRESVFRVE